MEQTHNPHSLASSSDTAFKQVEAQCFAQAVELYGKPLPETVADRLEQELTMIQKSGSSHFFWSFSQLQEQLINDGQYFEARGTIASSFVAYLLGITEINPLKSHYRCPRCKRTLFFDERECSVGADLPDTGCPHCRVAMEKLGYTIPAEAFFGLDGEAFLNFSGNTSAEATDFLHSVTEKELHLRPFSSLSMFRDLASETKTNLSDIPLNDPEIWALIESQRLVGLGSLSPFRLPPLYPNTDVGNTLLTIQPIRSLSELIQVCGHIHSTGTWSNNGETIFHSGTASFNDLISSRDDLFLALKRVGSSRSDAYRIAECVRKGYFCKCPDSCKAEQEKILLLQQNGRLPEWYFTYLKKILYLFPRAQIVTAALRSYRLTWFKKYYPEVFYRLAVRKALSENEAEVRALMEEAAQDGMILMRG